MTTINRFAKYLANTQATLLTVPLGYALVGLLLAISSGFGNWLVGIVYFLFLFVSYIEQLLYQKADKMPKKGLIITVSALNVVMVLCVLFLAVQAGVRIAVMLLLYVVVQNADYYKYQLENKRLYSSVVIIKDVFRAGLLNMAAYYLFTKTLSLALVWALLPIVALYIAFRWILGARAAYDELFARFRYSSVFKYLFVPVVYAVTFLLYWSHFSLLGILVFLITSTLYASYWINRNRWNENHKLAYLNNAYFVIVLVYGVFYYL